MKTKILSLFLLAVGNVATQPMLEIKIVPHASLEGYGTEINGFAASYVVVKNKSKTDLNIWSQECSLGEKPISFEVTDSGKKVFSVTKLPQDWDNNSPLPYLLKKDESYVYPILFDEKWKGFPDSWVRKKAKIRAVFRFASSPQEEKYVNHMAKTKFWAGIAQSEEIESFLDFRTQSQIDALEKMKEDQLKRNEEYLKTHPKAVTKPGK